MTPVVGWPGSAGLKMEKIGAERSCRDADCYLIWQTIAAELHVRVATLHGQLVSAEIHRPPCTWPASASASLRRVSVESESFLVMDNSFELDVSHWRAGD